MKVLPDNILRCMNPADRPGGQKRTAAELIVRGARVAERTMHDQFSSWLTRNSDQYEFDHNDFSRKSTSRTGMPDFRIFKNSWVLFIEFKVPGNSLSPEQQQRVGRLRATGSTVLVLSSYLEAINQTRTFFTR